MLILNDRQCLKSDGLKRSDRTSKSFSLTARGFQHQMERKCATALYLSSLRSEVPSAKPPTVVPDAEMNTLRQACRPPSHPKRGTWQPANG